MVIPCMGAFIAWGFITALFIPTGWIPNENFNQLVSPMSMYMLPMLMAFMGGRLVHDIRGGIIGVVGTFGLIIGADIPMFLGAMIMGPLSAWILKKFDKAADGKIPAGFEMIVNNFSLGILGMLLSLLSYSFIGPAILQANKAVTVMIQAIVDTGALPLLAIINEPAKVLFLNNVIDQGIYYPLGMQQSLEAGKSIFFCVASNPGSGLGLLLAYAVFGKGEAKRTAPGAIIIHFFGGIHEIYFPYVLMKPVTILGMIAGSICGILTFNLFGAGLVAGPSPGSIFAYLALTPRGNFVGIIAGVLVATAVSFLVNSFLIRISGDTDDEELRSSQEKSRAMKQEGKDVLANAVGEKEAPAAAATVTPAEYKHIAFACDAGLGSSAMGATNFRKRLQKAGLDITVKNYAIEKVPADADIIVTHQSLHDRAVNANPGKRIVTIKNFLKDAAIEELYTEITGEKND